MISPKRYINVYSVLRLADGLGIEEIILVSPSPFIRERLEHKIHFRREPWNIIIILDSIEDLVSYVNGEFLVSMELHPRARDITTFQWKDDPVIVVGPEDGNIPDEIISISDDIVKLPMRGKVRCLNVACAATLAAWDYFIKKHYTPIPLSTGEEIVYNDEDFIIIKHPADPNGYVYEVVPVDDQGKRLDDWEICPEERTLKDALDLMEKYRGEIRSYKLGKYLGNGSLDSNGGI